MVRWLHPIPSNWITIGCRVITAIIQPTHVIGASYQKTILWASQYSSGGQATQTAEVSVESDGTDFSHFIVDTVGALAHWCAHRPSGAIAHRALSVFCDGGARGAHPLVPLLLYFPYNKYDCP